MEFFFLLFFVNFASADIKNFDDSSQQSIRGSILYVGGSGPGNYSNIQDAIDNASDGDTIFVFNGTYIGYVVINKSIDLIGEDKNSTIIIGYFAFTISIVTDWVNVSGFYFLSNARFGEGVRIDSSNSSFCNNIVNIPNDRVRINGYNNIFSDNIVYGESIYLTGNRNTISGNIISNNFYGIFLTYACNNIISNNSFFYSGLYLSENNVCKNYIVDNIVNNKPLVYLYDTHDMIITALLGPSYPPMGMVIDPSLMPWIASSAICFTSAGRSKPELYSMTCPLFSRVMA